MELKDLLTYVNIEDVNEETGLDEFKKAFGEKFIVKAELEEEKKKLGQRLGSATTETKRFFKEQGLEFEDGETKDKSIEDLIALGVTKITAKHEEEIKSLKDDKGKTNDKKFLELEEKLKSQETQWEQDKGMIEKLKGELEEEKNGRVQDQRSFIINDRIKTSKAKIKFIDDITEVQRRGFDAIINEIASFEMDENQNVYPVNKEGKRFENKNKSGEYLNTDEFFKEQAIEQKLYKNNDGGGSQTPSFVPDGSQRKPEVARRKAHPNA